jgi:RimJ/RimL family protein N-acetyltransferase
MTVLVTRRMRLEPFTDAHLEGLHAIDSDPQVMRFIPGGVETREQTQATIERVKARWLEWGYSWWSFIELASGQIVGSGCIQHLGRDRANPLEIGWRLRRDRWRQGLAIEAAEAMGDFAFDTVGAGLLCAVCYPDNLRSAGLMERLGMRYRGIEHWYDADMKVYETTRPEWMRRRAAGRA